MPGATPGAMEKSWWVRWLLIRAGQAPTRWDTVLPVLPFKGSEVILDWKTMKNQTRGHVLNMGLHLTQLQKTQSNLHRLGGWLRWFEYLLLVAGSGSGGQRAVWRLWGWLWSPCKYSRWQFERAEGSLQEYVYVGYWIRRHMRKVCWYMHILCIYFYIYTRTPLMHLKIFEVNSCALALHRFRFLDLVHAQSKLSNFINTCL